MFERLSAGWAMARQSWSVLKLDRELLLFPLFSGIACLLVLASFAVPIYFSDLLNLDGAMSRTQQIVLAVVAFLFYFANYFVIIFFNSALVACAIIRLKGGDPTVRDGMSAALARIPQIVGWALVSATVGVVLKAIESNSERFGEIVSGLLGMAWSITTFFVVPLLVVEKTGPVDAFKRSASIMRDTWGESLAANFGIGLFSFIGYVLCIVPIVLGGMAMGSSAIVGGVLIGLGIIGLLLVSLVSSALNSIVLAALYIYAVEGTAPDHFDSAMVKNAFG